MRSSSGRCPNSKIKQGGTIRNLIAVLFAVLLIIFMSPVAETTSTVKNIKNQVKPTLAAKVVTADPTVEQKTKAEVKTEKSKPKPKSIEISTHPNGCSTYDSIFSKYSWNVRTAEAICMAESGGRVNALSSTHDRGLMQINSVHSALVNGNLSELYNPYTNIRVAYAVYVSSGWRAWTTYKTGAYLKYY